jgi:hypothetical protein
MAVAFLVELERDEFRRQSEILQRLLVRVLAECTDVPAELRAAIEVAFRRDVM